MLFVLLLKGSPAIGRPQGSLKWVIGHVQKLVSLGLKNESLEDRRKIRRIVYEIESPVDLAVFARICFALRLEIEETNSHVPSFDFFDTAFSYSVLALGEHKSPLAKKMLLDLELFCKPDGATAGVFYEAKKKQAAGEEKDSSLKKNE